MHCNIPQGKQSTRCFWYHVNGKTQRCNRIYERYDNSLDACILNGKIEILLINKICLFFYIDLKPVCFSPLLTLMQTIYLHATYSTTHHYIYHDVPYSHTAELFDFNYMFYVILLCSNVISMATGTSTVMSQWYQWLVQEKCNSSVLTIELQLSCTNPLIWGINNLQNDGRPEAILDLLWFMVNSAMAVRQIQTIVQVI